MPFITNRDASLFYTDQGPSDAVPCLLLHGWTCDSHDWSFQIPVLLQRGFRVIAMDFRGHGHSSAPEDEGAYHLRTLTEDAVALLRYLKVQSTILVGHSMGTIVASILAAEHTDLVKALVLVHPIYGLDVAANMDTFHAKVAANPSEAPQMTADLFLRIMYKPGTPEWIKTWTYRRVLGTAPQSIIGCIKSNGEVAGTILGKTEECKAFMRKRTMPRLAIATSDEALDWENELGVREQDEVLSFDKEYVFLHLIAPEKFNEALLVWLERIGLAKAASAML